MELEGRVILVTGGARRLGRAICLRLAREGAALAVHYHTSAADAARTAADCATAGGAAETFAADLADPAACEGLVADVRAKFGRLDVLVNNASVFERMTLDDFRLDDWERTLRVNLTAPMVLAHAARDALVAARGRIVNLLDAATPCPWPGHLAYMASKGALETLTRALARALAPEVNVVGVAPGVAEWPEDYDAALKQKILARVPLRRAGSPEDIAETVWFLLRHGDYITGTTIPVDGGRGIV